MTRLRDGAGLDTLSTDAEIELRIGLAADRDSVFRSVAARLAARTTLARIDETRDRLSTFLFLTPLLAELNRRHHQHWSPGDDDPRYPATFNAVACDRCNVNGYQPFAEGH